MIDVPAILDDLSRRRGMTDRRVTAIELNRSAPTAPAIALLVFEGGGAEPIAFVKATADTARAELLRREFDNLSLLAASGDEAFRRSVPRPFYCERLGALTVLAESATAGTRMKDHPPDRYFSSRRFRDDYTHCMRWLACFDRAVNADAVERTGDDAQRAVARYRRTHSVSESLDQLLDEAVTALASSRVRGVASHGDFCTANVILPAHGEPFVIDWEYPLDRAWPLGDLLYFTCSTWCTPYRKGREALRRNYERLFFEEHGFRDLIRTEATAYLSRLKLDRELALPLAVVSWVAFANRKHDELAESGAQPDGHLPLILVEDGACANLEILAERRESFLL